MAKITGTNGIILFGSAFNITNATGNAGTVTVTASGHTFVAGDRVRIKNVSGMTDLNGSHTVATAGTGTLTITFQTSQTYTSGGSIQNCLDVTEFSLDAKVEISDTTDSSNAAAGYKTFLSKGFTEASGSAGGFFLSATNKPTIGSAVTVILSMDSGNNYYSGSGIITAQTNALQITGTEATKVTYTFQMSGTVTQGVGA